MSTRSVSPTRLRRLGRELYALRKAAGLTQREAAAAAGVSRDTVIRAEAGTHRTRSAALSALLDAYGVPPTKRDRLFALAEGVGTLDPDWQRSTPGADGGCLECGFLPGLVLLRSGDDPQGTILEITSDVFNAFIADIEAGLFRQAAETMPNT